MDNLRDLLIHLKNDEMEYFDEFFEKTKRPTFNLIYSYIKDCDESQIKWLLKEDPLFVDKSLPYAIAFGLESQFIKKTTPLVEDWNAKYLFWKKVSFLGEVISWLSRRINFFDSIRMLFKF